MKIEVIVSNDKGDDIEAVDLEKVLKVLRDQNLPICRVKVNGVITV